MCICSTYCLCFHREKSGIFSVWRAVTLCRIRFKVAVTGTHDVVSFELKCRMLLPSWVKDFIPEFGVF